MKDNGYSQDYIRRIQKEIECILEKEEGNSWQSYGDIYCDYLKTPHSPKWLCRKRNIIGTLEKFDVFGRFPGEGYHHVLIRQDAYHLLKPEFRELIGFYRAHENLANKKESTIGGGASNASSFLYQMQKQGAQTLDEIAEGSVLSFFLSEDGSFKRNHGSKALISTVLKIGLEWKEAQCRRALSFLPALKRPRKNIQYLTPVEIRLLREAVEKEAVSARDKAIILLLLFTGLRGCDIAGLALGSIDWEKERILATQQKTSVPVEIPLSAIVGNAIYDCLTQERPDSGDSHLFLTARHPFIPLGGGGCVTAIVGRVFKTAGIRKNPGDRKGSHLFRHNLASSLLANSVPQPVITQTLGNTRPESLEPYLRADFAHLKDCAISIAGFPLAKGVLSVWEDSVRSFPRRSVTLYGTGRHHRTGVTAMRGTWRPLTATATTITQMPQP